jgi:CRP-like cAMP-binding protein
MTQTLAAQPSHSLKSISVFTDLPPATLAQIEKRCRWRRCEAGETIVDYLDESDDVFFITRGEARVSIYSVDGKSITFSDLGPGDFFGEVAAVDGGARSASIEARTDCVVASMSAVTFREMLQSDPIVTSAVLRHLVARIRALTTRVYEFSALAVSNRVQAEILRLAKLAPREGKHACIDAAPTHAEIASRVSSHREAVTRELNRLSRIGIVKRQGKALIVNDVERLATMVREATGE